MHILFYPFYLLNLINPLSIINKILINKFLAFSKIINKFNIKIILHLNNR